MVPEKCFYRHDPPRQVIDCRMMGQGVMQFQVEPFTIPGA